MTICLECGKRLKHPGKVCSRCRKTVFVKCACGCGTPVLKYGGHGKYKRDGIRFMRGHGNKLYHSDTERKVAKTKQKRVGNQRRKVAMIKYKGSKCSNCGIKYDGTNGCIFQFHHINANQKISRGSSRSLCLSDLNLDAAKTEVDKCELLCANCHFKHHSEPF